PGGAPIDSPRFVVTYDPKNTKVLDRFSRIMSWTQITDDAGSRDKTARFLPNSRLPGAGLPRRATILFPQQGRSGEFRRPAIPPWNFRLRKECVNARATFPVEDFHEIISGCCVRPAASGRSFSGRISCL